MPDPLIRHPGRLVLRVGFWTAAQFQPGPRTGVGGYRYHDDGWPVNMAESQTDRTDRHLIRGQYHVQFHVHFQERSNMDDVFRILRSFRRPEG